MSMLSHGGTVPTPRNTTQSRKIQRKPSGCTCRSPRGRSKTSNMQDNGQRVLACVKYIFLKTYTCTRCMCTEHQGVESRLLGKLWGTRGGPRREEERELCLAFEFVLGITQEEKRERRKRCFVPGAFTKPPRQNGSSPPSSLEDNSSLCPPPELGPHIITGPGAQAYRRPQEV